ncbi:MAG: type I-E CRISPR-associated protein Cse2/CasB [Propioniciclava sp.]
MTTTTSQASHGLSQLIRSHVSGQVSALQREYLRNQGGSGAAAVAALAKLRRVDPLDPGGEPQAYALIFESLPGDLLGRGDEPSGGELAVGSALHLFALHQQGRADPTHDPRARFGGSIRRLAYHRGSGADLDDSVVTRFNHLCRASSDATRIAQLRSLIMLMRSAHLGLDYGQLATDLFWLHRNPHDSRVYLRWARDFHRPTKEDNAPTDKPSAGA